MQVLVVASHTSATPRCSSSGRGLQYLSGDALTDPADCLGPQGQLYPHQEVARCVDTRS